MSDGDPTRYDVPPVGPGEVPPGGAEGLPPGDLPPPPDRRPWIIGGLAAVILIVAIALLLLGDDDDDEVATDGSTSSTTSSLPAVTTSSTSSTTSTTAAAVVSSTTEAPATTITAPVDPVTTVAPAPTTTVPPPPVTLNPVLCTAAGDNRDRPDFAAQAVHEAFLRGDENCAAALMTEDARRALFAMTPVSRQFQGCTPVDDNPPQDCVFASPGTTELRFLMNLVAGGDGDVWQVFEVEEG